MATRKKTTSQSVDAPETATSEESVDVPEVTVPETPVDVPETTTSEESVDAPEVTAPETPVDVPTTKIKSRDPKINHTVGFCEQHFDFLKNNDHKGAITALNNCCRSAMGSKNIGVYQLIYDILLRNRNHLNPVNMLIGSQAIPPQERAAMENIVLVMIDIINHRSVNYNFEYLRSTVNEVFVRWVTSKTKN